MTCFHQGNSPDRLIVSMLGVKNNLSYSTIKNKKKKPTTLFRFIVRSWWAGMISLLPPPSFFRK